MAKSRGLSVREVTAWFQEKMDAGRRLRAQAAELRKQADEREAAAVAAEDEVRGLHEALEQRLVTPALAGSVAEGSGSAPTVRKRRRRGKPVAVEAPTVRPGAPKSMGVAEAILHVLQNAGRPLLSGELTEEVKNVRPRTSDKVVQVVLYRLRKDHRLARRKVRGKGRTYRYTVPSSDDQS